jgi:hypothetical protein
VTSIAAVATAAIFAMLPSAEVWAALTPGDCPEYCEASTRCGALATRAAIQQPLNTWSNLAFLFAGALVLRRPLDRFAVLFAASCAVLAVGSFLFHATVTQEMQWLDMVGTYAALVAVLARGVAASFALPAGLVLAAALVADGLFAVFKWSISATVALPLLLVAIAIPMTRAVLHGRRTAREALVPFAVFLAALLLRQLDVAHVGCHPESRLYQGHALWHLGTAASLALIYFFFDPPARAENA